MINQLELRHFVYFTTLAETLHFGKAADQLFITQSALSQQIKRLEAILGKQLIVRNSRNVRLSPAGELFKTEAEIVINQINRSLENWSAQVDGSRGILKICFVGSAMRSFLPQVLQEFSTLYPEVTLHLNDYSNLDQLISLEKMQIDVGFLRSKPTSDQLECISVVKENLTLVLPKNHRINSTNFRNLGQLSKESYILFPNEKSLMFYQQIINVCLEHGFSPRIKHQTIHGPTIFKLVEIGQGISIVPSSLVDRHNYDLQYIELDKIKQKTELFAVWNKHNANPSFLLFKTLLLHEVATT